MRPWPNLLPDSAPTRSPRVIKTAWDDRPPFNAVLLSHGLTEGQLVALLRRELTPNAYKLWVQRSGKRR